MINPIVLLPSESDQPTAAQINELRAEAKQRRQLTAWRLIGINLLVLVLNALVAARGIAIWGLLQRLQVVEWIQRARPHVGVTLHAMRALDWLTRPVRWPLQRVRSGLQRPPPTPPPPITPYARLAGALESGPWASSS